MIRKHVDLIAIALLLALIGFCSHARVAILAGVRSPKAIGTFSPYRGHMTTEAPRIHLSLD